MDGNLVCCQNMNNGFVYPSYALHELQNKSIQIFKVNAAVTKYACSTQLHRLDFSNVNFVSKQETVLIQPCTLSCLNFYYHLTFKRP